MDIDNEIENNIVREKNKAYITHATQIRCKLRQKNNKFFMKSET
mgnify:CR=1 FL=1